MSASPVQPGSGIGGAPADQEDPRADLRWGTVPNLVADLADRLGGGEAVNDGATSLTFAQLAERAAVFTRALMSIGVEPGDRVAIWAPNCTEWVIGALGVHGAAGAIVPLNTRFKGGEAAYVLRSSGAKVLLTVSGFLGVDYPQMLAGEDVGELSHVVLLRHEDLDSDATGPTLGATPIDTLDTFEQRGASVSADDGAARARSVQPDDVSDLIYTSGTTGRPKGAVTSHAQSLRTFGTWSAIVGLTEGDRYLVVNPFFHTFGYKAGMLASLMAGATIVPEAVFDVDVVLARIEAERISVLPGPPTLYQSILAHPDRSRHDLTSLRLGVTGAAVVPVELVVAMREELGFDTVLTAYGLTESCGTVTMCRRSDAPEVISATSGRAIPDLEVRIVGEDGDELTRGEPGEIVVRGYTVMSGYWDDAEESAKAIDGDGWLHTGDIGTMDEHGNVTITDRLKDMFMVGGFNAYPAEIEAILRQNSLLGAVSVIGVPDERMGEVGCVYMVPSESSAGSGEESSDAMAQAVLQWARGAMANYKVPRYGVVVESLPVNASGKVLKRELRERFAAGLDRVVTTERKS